MKYTIIYLAAVSVLSAIITAWDKLAAKLGRRRVPEKTLFFLAAVGGSAAMYLTMLAVRHKTRHKKFMLGLPVMLLIQIIIISAVIWLRINNVS